MIIPIPEPRWGVCAVAIPRESYYWLEDWISFHLRAGASMVIIYDNTGSQGSRRGDSVFSQGKLQREQRSKRGEEYGKLTDHLTDLEIQAHLLEVARKHGESRVKVIPWLPRDERTGSIIHGQVEAYDDCVSRFKDELEWCAFIDMDEYLYCRRGFRVGGILREIKSTCPEYGIIQLRAWQFLCRWGTSGPNDIVKYEKHLPCKPGGEKNIVRLKDVVSADIHWYWKMSAGVKMVKAPEEIFAFCHYNARPEQIEENGISTIRPRAYID